MRILSKALAIMTVAGGLAMNLAPVSAAPSPGPMTATNPASDASVLVEQATFYRNRGWRGDRDWRRGGDWRGNRGWRRGNVWRGDRGWRRGWNGY